MDTPQPDPNFVVALATIAENITAALKTVAEISGGNRRQFLLAVLDGDDDPDLPLYIVGTGDLDRIIALIAENPPPPEETTR